jgi:hypothetical protein
MSKSYYQLFLLALLPICFATTFPAVVEVDLIFPRNDTYVPTPLMPVVFAIHNSQLADPLDMAISWVLLRGTEPGFKFLETGTIELENAHFSSNEPYFAIDSMSNISTSEGIWTFTWSLGTGNCSNGDTYSPTIIGSNITTTFNSQIFPVRTVFTTKNGMQQPDLVAATADDACANIESFTFNVTGTLDLPYTPNEYGNRKSCAILASLQSTPTPNPCGAKLNASAASSISAALSSCAAVHNPTTKACLPKSNNGFSSKEQYLFGDITWLIAPFLWLLYIFC